MKPTNELKYIFLDYMFSFGNIVSDFHVKSTRKLTNRESSYRLEPAELSGVFIVHSNKDVNFFRILHLMLT